METQVIAIFDIGKTNKKLLLFDKYYQIMYERSAKFEDILDEDGDYCENLQRLRLFIYDSLLEILRQKEFNVVAINFSTYGASLVFIDEKGESLTPLYNYLKPYPERLKDNFYNLYGGKEKIALETCSPILGSLNSGMQLYRLKHEKPSIYCKTKFALHLPQYLSYTLTGSTSSDITSIGCHTQLWDFKNKKYADWVYEEEINEKLAPIKLCDDINQSAFPGSNLLVGVGIHDSSAAILPYLLTIEEPFVLISTGTWCISLNPFNHSPLTLEDSNNDCLCYLSYLGNPIKASRLFSGQEHEEQVKRIAQYYNQEAEKYAKMEFDLDVYNKIKRKEDSMLYNSKIISLKKFPFKKRSLAETSSDKEAYHQLIFDLARQQVLSTGMILKGTEVKQIFVDGGFSKNSVFMNMLAYLFPEMKVYAASIAQASSLGAALAIHNHWNETDIPSDLIELQRYNAKS